ncbi:nucleotide exchange factor GrpE [Candidatus Saccharibacteria bacterium]|jgi:molecular chaperone GrpE|nr:nucleotide exchange factor GrpE [Candidatus Saccharibacteria bacterium]
MKKQSENDKLNEKITELTNDLQRTRADFENYRKQVEVQKENATNAAKLATVYKFLPLLDDIERALKTYPELAPLAKTLAKSITDLGLKRINSSVGLEFNPTYHDAVMVEDSEGEKEVIAETLRPGYCYENEVLRPAMVKVKHV